MAPDLNQHLSKARKARWKKTSKEARSAHAKKMAAARWKKKVPTMQEIIDKLK